MLKKKLLQKGDKCTCPVAVIIRDKKIISGLRHYTPDKWKTISVWTVPGGRCDQGDTLESALRREIQEEIGITEVEIEDYLGEVPGAKEGDIVPIFLCSTKQEPKLMEPEKFSEWSWKALEEISESFINQNALNVIKSLNKF